MHAYIILTTLSSRRKMNWLEESILSLIVYGMWYLMHVCAVIGTRLASLSILPMAIYGIYTIYVSVCVKSLSLDIRLGFFFI